MDIILLDYIDKVGDKHEVVKVRDGFGRNYLIPKGLGIVANKTNLARLNGLKKQAEKKENAMLDTYREYAAKLASKTLQIASKAGESGRLFGSVTSQHLVDTIKEDLGLTIEKRMVEMPEEVKELGAYEAIVRFHAEVMATVKFEVVREKKATSTPVDETSSDRQAVEAPVEVAAAAPIVEEAVAPVVEAVAEVAEQVEETVVAETAAIEEAAETVAEEVAETVEDTAEAVEEVIEEAPVAAVEAAVEEIETAVEDEVVAEAAPSDDDAEGSEDESEKEA